MAILDAYKATQTHSEWLYAFILQLGNYKAATALYGTERYLFALPRHLVQ